MGNFCPDEDYALSVNWGDGTLVTSTLNTTPRPTGFSLHTYSANGDYTVILTATDVRGVSKSTTCHIVIQNCTGGGSGSGSGSISGNGSGTTSGSGSSTGSASGSGAASGSAIQCAPTVAFVTPEANAALHNIARIRVTVADPNEQTDPCHTNYSRPCNHEPDGPALQLYLSDALLPLIWKHVSGTPLNGTWETFLDTRDISNGSHTLRVSARGVGCCRKDVIRAVTLNNTLQANIFYRDTRREVKAGLVIPDAVIGIETRALEENTARRYWMETAVRSGTDLDASFAKPYNHDDWPKHQPVLLTSGEHWDASGKRVERTNYSAHVTFRLPLSNAVRVRRKWTPQFYLSAYDLNAERVAKIRPIKDGRHFVFTTGPARVWIYENDAVTLYGDFATPPIADSGQLGTADHEADFDFIDHAGSNIYAQNAVDATVLGDGSTDAKVYVIVPPASPTERGEVFAFDPDSGQLALEYGIRRENRVPRFIETVKNRVVCLYTHDAETHLPAGTPRTRTYDLTFPGPRLLWQLPAPATLTSVDGDTLLVACGTKLYSTDGPTAPALLNDFPSPVTSASLTFVGLQNGQLWKKTSAGYVHVYTRPFPIAGLTSWSAGTALKASPGAGEPQTDPPRGVCAGEGVWIYGERKDGTWFDERDLRVPADLTAKSKTVARITALDHYSLTITPPSDANTNATDASTPPQRDERLLIGTAASGLLFVYQRSLLSEEKGAIPVSHDTIPRLFPFPRQKTD